MGPLAVTDDSPANYDEDLIVKPKTGLNRANNDYKYTLETSGTNATTVESFSSSSEENTQSFWRSLDVKMERIFNPAFTHMFKVCGQGQSKEEY